MTDRWDAPAGTVARVESVGHAGVLQGWCFTVEWLNRADHYGRHRHTSLNLFEEDLQDFEVPSRPIVPSPDRIPSRRAMIPRATAEQLCLPYGHDDTIPERPPTGTSISELVRLGLRRGPMRAGRGRSDSVNMGSRPLPETTLANTASISIRGSLFSALSATTRLSMPTHRESFQTVSEPDPGRFRNGCKVWEEITIPSYAQHARYGVEAGRRTNAFSTRKCSASWCCNHIATKTSCRMPARFCSSFNGTVCWPENSSHAWMHF